MTDAPHEYTLSDNLQTVLSNTLKAPHWHTASDHLCVKDALADPMVVALVEAAKGYLRAIDAFDGSGEMTSKIARLQSWRSELDAALTAFEDKP